MGQTVLTKTQEKFLELFQKKPQLYNNFILSGGTALAGFYLYHRYSEDLDFFSKNEFNPSDIFPILKIFLKPLGFQKIEYQQSFNRNLYFFTKKNTILKTEFTYFPFKSVTKPIVQGNLQIDSLHDIAINKVFTIYQKPRLRDFIDLYVILQAKKYTLSDLLKSARIKFDTHLDKLQWGSQLLQVATLKDYPRLIKKIDLQKIIGFFSKKAAATGQTLFK